MNYDLGIMLVAPTDCVMPKKYECVITSMNEL